MRHILGISAYYHDAAAALLREGEIVAAAQEERFSRRKNDERFPHHAVSNCLEQGGLTAADLDAVVFYDKPVVKFARLLETGLAIAPRGFKAFLHAMPSWLGEKLNLRQTIREELPGLSTQCQILFTQHHQAHAASAFYPSPFSEAAVLTIDGVGEYATTTIGQGRHHRLELFKELRFPHSLGLLYSTFTAYCGFRINSGEYKLMGLAPYGEPRFVQAIYQNLIDLKPDGSFWLNLDYFDFLRGLRMTNEKFHRLFGGPPRTAEEPLESRDADVPRSIQSVTEEIMLRLARHAREITGKRNLCVAGGVALNCVANGVILREKIFERIWIQPAAGDAGGALGAALAVWHGQAGEANRPQKAITGDEMHWALLGPEYSPAEIEAVLRTHHAVYERLEEGALLARAVEMLQQEKIVGWFQGRMEFGPRALGNRSILGDARSPRMQSMINLKIKFRESFRPFAPVVRRERLTDCQIVSQTVLTFVMLLASATLSICLVRPSWFRPVYEVGMTISFHFGQVAGTFVLAIFFWLVLTPMGLLLRLLGKDLLMRRRRTATTYWQPARISDQFDRQFCLPWLAALFLIASGLRSGAADWQVEAGYRSAPLPVPQAGQAGFTLLPGSITGILFTNVVPERRHLTNQILLNGSGVAAGDMDGDGRCDLFFCHLGGPGALYRNLGNWKFQDITEAAGVANPNRDVTGAAFADLDGDADLDLIINSVGGGTHLFLNDGKGHFAESPLRLNPGRGGMSLALADIDDDGYLDLYVANYRTSALMDIPNAHATFKRVRGKVVMDRLDGRPTTEPDLTNRFVVSVERGIEEVGEPDVLYRNQGGTNLIPVSFTDGSFSDEDGRPLTEPPYDWGLAVMFRDINGDSLPDLYVCNDFQSPDRIWINQGAGKFRAISRLALRKTSRYSMGIDFADLNRDGIDDFIVLDMLSREHRQRMTQIVDVPLLVTSIGDLADRPQYGLNTLFLGRGDGTYAEIAQFSGLEGTEWSWTPIFLDVDLDGWEDVLVSNGQERAARDIDVVEKLKAMRAARKRSDAEIFQARRMFPRLATANLAFRNARDLTFKEMGHEWGFDFKGVSHGMCLADLDDDGDLDVVVNNLNGPAGIYRNENNAPRVAVRLKGRAPNTRGIGAKIRVHGGAVPMQSQEMICGGRYLSSDDPMRVFAAGNLTNEMRIEVKWRSGKWSVVNGVKANRIYELDEAGAESQVSSKFNAPSSREAPITNPQSPVTVHESRITNHESGLSNFPPVFEDVSHLIQHNHHEEEYNDFARQPLLPRKLSQLGPGVSWFDADGDGWEDLIIGSGRGGRLALYLNDGNGGFRRTEAPPFNQSVTRDQSSILGWVQEGRRIILAGSANYEDASSLGASVRQYDVNAGKIGDMSPGQESSTGPLALADYDGDGDLDLFVGGRVIPGRYPEGASSRLFRNEGGKMVLDTENTNALARVGLVSGVVFSDLDGDGKPELVLACEWGPVRVFHNESGRWVEVTEKVGLAQYKGWWNGVTTGDLDGDGRLDIVASNWGRNTKYETHRRQPLRLFYGDFAGDGMLEVVEAYFDPEMKKVVPDRGLDALGKSMPFLFERFSTYRAYAEASVEEILGDRLKQTGICEANWLESTVFFNRGDRFEARPLPMEAQIAPAFAVCVGDMDGDGREDVFLSQNFFATQPETPRFDAGRGLWLKGDGGGGFEAAPGQVSGVKVYGEQRGAALCDYDGDRRVDVVVTQNGGETKLYHNVGAKPGLRVRLKGPPGNPHGIGAQLRLHCGQWQGPVREIHAGSGYWSQDSVVQVLATPESPTQIWVRWPGGKTNKTSVPPGASELEVTIPN